MISKRTRCANGWSLRRKGSSSWAARLRIAFVVFAAAAAFAPATSSGQGLSWRNVTFEAETELARIENVQRDRSRAADGTLRDAYRDQEGVGGREWGTAFSQVGRVKYADEVGWLPMVPGPSIATYTAAGRYEWSDLKRPRDVEILSLAADLKVPVPLAIRPRWEMIGNATFAAAMDNEYDAISVVAVGRRKEDSYSLSAKFDIEWEFGDRVGDGDHRRYQIVPELTYGFRGELFDDHTRRSLKVGGTGRIRNIHDDTYFDPNGIGHEWVLDAFAERVWHYDTSTESMHYSVSGALRWQIRGMGIRDPHPLAKPLLCKQSDKCWKIPGWTLDLRVGWQDEAGAVAWSFVPKLVYGHKF